ncbi:MAG: hypothetical protein JRF20_10175 [Deltaproteobacteria bacterium]|nr:hypothetical protein [Deltaproteobacteria bacterium]
MASGIAHDFNNILTGILGYTNLLKLKIGQNSDIGRYADIIERAGLRAADLVTKLLAFSRDSQPGQSRASAVNEIVQETLELMKSSLHKNIETKFSLQEDLPLIKCDPTQVQQAILNIYLNALDAMPNGGRLSVELLSRVVYGALGGDSIFFYTIDKFYTSNYFCQSL